jgi:hypothetical protein
MVRHVVAHATSFDTQAAEGRLIPIPASCLPCERRFRALVARRGGIANPCATRTASASARTVYATPRVTRINPTGTFSIRYHPDESLHHGPPGMR